MKNILLAAICLLLIQPNSFAQYWNINTSAGLRINANDKALLKGVSLKVLFDLHNQIEQGFLFNSHQTSLFLEYRYIHKLLVASNLKWYCGFGPSIDFNKNDIYDEFGDYVIREHSTKFKLIPFLGLDYIIGRMPLEFSVDWRPLGLNFENTVFNPRQAGLSMHYLFK